MRKLMAIFAHPDDESAISCSLHQYAQNGVEVTLVCATRGEAGSISDPSLATPETLGAVRQKELEVVCEIIGIHHLEFLDYRDSGMAGTPENEDPRAFVQADENEVVAKIDALIQRYDPDIVVTFEPLGWYGHPDHRATSKWATKAFLDGQHEHRKLFHAVIPYSKFGAMVQEAVEGGHIEMSDKGLNSHEDEDAQRQQLETESNVTHIVDITSTFDLKWDAMAKHETQFSPEHMFRKIPRAILRKAAAAEYFIQVHPEPSSSNGQYMDDLFA